MMRTPLILCFSSALLLAGCDQNGSPFQSEPIKTKRLEGKILGKSNGGEEIRAWRDPETGCHYLLWRGRRSEGGITPRLTPDGRPMCGPEDSAK
jgi:hypothetical protein